MNKFMNMLQKHLMPFAQKLSTNMYLSSLTETMITVLPLIMVGSFACLFANVNIEVWQQFLAQHSDILMIFNKVQSYTVNLIAIYVLIVLSYKISKKHGLEAIAVSILSVAVFILLTPSEVNVSISQDWLGYKGMITGILLGMLVPTLMKAIKNKNLVIKMPDSVPDYVAESFSSLIPVILIIVGTEIIDFVMVATGQGSLHQMIYNVLQIPFQHLSSSLAGTMIFMFACALMMPLGIHANTILYVIFPIYLANGAANLAAYQANEPLPNIVTSTWFMHIVPGSIGCVLPLILLLVTVAKSERLKSVGRISLIPNLFNISEPVLFGAPILFNPVLMIPYITCSVLNVFLGYILMYFNIVPRLNGVEVVWSMPIVLSGVLAQGWQFALLQIVLVIIDLLIYYPFVKTYDNTLLEEEAKKGGKA